MAYGGPEEDEVYRKFVTFQGSPENLTKFLSTHKPSDPSWNKYVRLAKAWIAIFLYLALHYHVPIIMCF